MDPNIEATLAKIDKRIAEMQSLRANLIEVFNEPGPRQAIPAPSATPAVRKNRKSKNTRGAAPAEGKLGFRDTIRLAIRDQVNDSEEFTLDAICKLCPVIDRQRISTTLSQLAKAGELLTVEHEDSRRGYRKNLSYGK